MSDNSSRFSKDYKAAKTPKSKPTEKGTVIYDPRGQWDHPGQITKIPGGNITMQDVNYPVLGVDNFGNQQMMYPGMDYTFPNADNVTEYPQMSKGGMYTGKGTPRKSTSQNIQTSINPLMTRNTTLFGPGGKHLFSPSMQIGGASETVNQPQQQNPYLKAAIQNRADKINNANRQAYEDQVRARVRAQQKLTPKKQYDEDFEVQAAMKEKQYTDMINSGTEDMMFNIGAEFLPAVGTLTGAGKYLSKLGNLSKEEQAAADYQNFHKELNINSPSSWANIYDDTSPNIFTKTIKKSVNKSGLTKEEALSKALAKDKEALSNMSELEFQETVMKPTGEVVPYKQGPQVTQMGYNSDIHGMQLKNAVPMTPLEYSNAFNEKIDLLNDIIAQKNKSGLEYRVKGLDPHGNLMFETPSMPGADRMWQTQINPGEWRGNIEDIANAEYYKSIPGLNMSNTSSSVFGDMRPRRGTGTYEAINEYLKRLDLGRVKPGFNSQTEFSKGLWENAINKGKAFGYYNNPHTVYGAMKSVAPYAIPTAVGAAALNQKKLGGQSNWLDKYQEGGGLTVSQIWEERTGLPWSEAHAMGLTDGSYDKNLQVRNALLNGQFDDLGQGRHYAQPVSAKIAPTENNSQNITKSKVQSKPQPIPQTISTPKHIQVQPQVQQQFIPPYIPKVTPQVQPVIPTSIKAPVKVPIKNPIQMPPYVPSGYGVTDIQDPLSQVTTPVTAVPKFYEPKVYNPIVHTQPTPDFSGSYGVTDVQNGLSQNTTPVTAKPLPGKDKAIKKSEEKYTPGTYITNAQPKSTWDFTKPNTAHKVNPDFPIQTGKYIDVATNTAYFFGPNGEVKSWPVLTGMGGKDKGTGNTVQYNKDVTEIPFNERVTPLGFYRSEKESPVTPEIQQEYFGHFRDQTPIVGPNGEPAPNAVGIGDHVTANTNPTNYKKRLATYSNSDPKARNLSFGCINNEDCNYMYQQRLQPYADTTMVFDSEANPKILKELQKRLKEYKEPDYQPSPIINTNLKSSYAPSHFQRGGGWLEKYN